MLTGISPLVLILIDTFYPNRYSIKDRLLFECTSPERSYHDIYFDICGLDFIFVSMVLP